MTNDEVLQSIAKLLVGAHRNLAALMADPSASVYTRVDLDHARHDIDRALGFIERVQGEPRRWDPKAGEK